MLDFLKSAAITLAGMIVFIAIIVGMSAGMVYLKAYHPLLIPFIFLGIVFVLLSIVVHIFRKM